VLPTMLPTCAPTFPFIPMRRRIVGPLWTAPDVCATRLLEELAAAQAPSEDVGAAPVDIGPVETARALMGAYSSTSDDRAQSAPNQGETRAKGPRQRCNTPHAP